MFKLSILAGFFFAIDAYRPLKCPQDYLWTQKGCIRDCKASRYSKCSQFHNLKSQPHFCGLNEEGAWHDFASECQACTSPGYIGVTKGSCDQLFKQPSKPDDKKDNQSKASLKPIYCGTNRPDEHLCPTRAYFAAPQLNICGISKQGKLKGFDIDCSACKDIQIQYFYETSCENIGIELPKTKNIKLNEQSQDLVTSKHEQNFCFDDTCCKSWETCIEKKCTDKCVLMRCMGNCVRGKCENVAN